MGKHTHHARPELQHRRDEPADGGEPAGDSAQTHVAVGKSRLVMGTRTGSPAACGCVDVQIHSQVVPTQVVACGSGARLHGAADGQFAPWGSTHQLVHAWVGQLV